jgi:integrase
MLEKVSEDRSLPPSTIKAYSQRIQQHIARIAEEDRVPHMAVGPWRLAEWIVANRPTWSRSTWRQYKAAACWVLLNKREVVWPLVRPEVSDSAHAYLICESQVGAKRKAEGTSSAKLKGVSEADLVKLFTYLTSSRSKSARMIAVLLVATIAAGLRPSEWLLAEPIAPEERFEFKLVVRNAKATYGRAHGEFRTLRWNEIDPRVKSAILEVCDTCADIMRVHHDPRAHYSTLLKSWSDELARASRILWPKRKRHITFYSARHQAAANFKCVYSDVEVAALMGHAVDDTAFMHYARPPKGTRGGLFPTPDPKEVARVRASGWREKFGRESKHRMRVRGPPR